MQTKILALVLLSATACTAASPEPSPPDAAEPAGTALGETVRVNGVGITPIEVIEDSRCPRDAACVWPGRLVLKIRIASGNRREEMELVLGEARPVAGGALTLTGASPEPLAGAPVQPDAYRFTFSFEGGL